MLIFFRDIKEAITIDFFEKGAAVNSASYCQLLKQNSPYLLNDPRINPYVDLYCSLIPICKSHAKPSMAVFLSHQLTPPLYISSGSFLIELFDYGRWPVVFFSLASGEARLWLDVGFIHLTSHSPCCFPWLLSFNLWVNLPVYSSSFSLLKIQLLFFIFLFSNPTVDLMSLVPRLQVKILKFSSSVLTHDVI